MWDPSLPSPPHPQAARCGPFIKVLNLTYKTVIHSVAPLPRDGLSLARPSPSREVRPWACVCGQLSGHGEGSACVCTCRHYDILEDRVPSGLVADYHSLLAQCEGVYRRFLNLRSSLSACREDSEQENVSMVQGLELYSELEQLKQKLKLIENPLLRCPRPAAFLS